MVKNAHKLSHDKKSYECKVKDQCELIRMGFIAKKTKKDVKYERAFPDKVLKLWNDPREDLKEV